MARIDRRALAKHLAQLEPDELQQELLRLYDLFPQVRDWYKTELDEGEGIVLEQYKTRITKAYFPKRGPGRRCNSNCRRWLSEYRKMATFDTDMIDLLLHRVECGLEAAKIPRKAKRYANYYTPLVTSFKEAFVLIARNQLEENYSERMAKLHKETRHLPFEMTAAFDAVKQALK